jgi:O-antigen/teichoic acid export membrane protein
MLIKLSKVIFRLKNSSFVRNFFIVMSGTAIAQIIGYALSPIISRLFTPADFGIFGSFNSLVSIVAAGITLEYTQAIIIQKDKRDSMYLFILSCLCTLIIGLLCMIFCLISPSTIYSLMKCSGVWIIIFLIIAIITAGINSALQAWCIWSKAFKQTASSQVIRSFSSNGTQLGLGLIKGGAAGLIIANVIADILACINLFRVILPDILAYRKHINFNKLKKLAREYSDFPKYAATQNMITSLSSGLPVLMLTNYFGISIAGAYAFGVQILHAPMGLILRALRQVLLQKAGETHNRGGSLTSIYLKITIALFSLALLPSIILFIWAPQIFSFIFGTRWHMAGQFARYIILWMLFVFCNLPAVLFAQVIRIQQKILIYDLAMFAGRVSTLILGGLFLTALNTIIIFSLLGAAMNLFLILLVGYNVMKKESEMSWASVRNVLTK